MAADIFGQRIDHDVRALVERTLPKRTKEGVIDGNRTFEPGLVNGRTDGFDIDKSICRIAGTFEIHHADVAALHKADRNAR